MRSVLLAAAIAFSGCSGSDVQETSDAGLHTSTPDAAVVVSPCGTCAQGSHCGTVYGNPVCRSDRSGVPLFSHVFVVLMENTSWKTLRDDNGHSPYLHGLMTSDAYATDYHGVAHPSLPNYIALTSGDTMGIGCDCDPTGSACNGLTCNALLHACGCPQQAQHLADQLEYAGITWRAYGEDMGATSPCNVTSSGGYAARHIPFLYYTNIQTNSARCNAHVVDYSRLPADIAANQVPRFVFVSPNLTNDMHDPFPSNATNLTKGDTWLAAEIPKLQATDAYKHGGIIVIVWDEDDNSGIPDADAAIPMYVLSPYGKKQYPSPTTTNHYALLATIEDGLSLPRLGNAQTATALIDFFPAN